MFGTTSAPEEVARQLPVLAVFGDQPSRAQKDLGTHSRVGQDRRLRASLTDYSLVWLAAAADLRRLVHRALPDQCPLLGQIRTALVIRRAGVGPDVLPTKKSVVVANGVLAAQELLWSAGTGLTTLVQAHS